MRHKKDAQKLGTELTEEFRQLGLDPEIARLSAISSLNFTVNQIRYGTLQHSLLVRTINYLKSLENATQLISIQ